MPSNPFVIQRSEHQTPTLPNQRVGHPEKPNQLLCIDVPEWYNSVGHNGSQKGAKGLATRLENKFNICINQGSVQISNYLERHVLGGTVLVCGN